MVIDTSIILSIFFEEKYADWALAELNKHAGELRMSTVNLTETLIHLQDRQPNTYEILEEALLYRGISFIAPDIEQAKIAAQARLNYPLNLGDCFAYALAKKEDCAILTLDKDFHVLDQTIVHPY